MDERAQGALEYLLLIGGAILVAVVVIVVLTGLTAPTKNRINEAANKLFNVLNI